MKSACARSRRCIIIINISTKGVVNKQADTSIGELNLQVRELVSCKADIIDTCYSCS